MSLLPLAFFASTNLDEYAMRRSTVRRGGRVRLNATEPRWVDDPCIGPQVFALFLLASYVR